MAASARPPLALSLRLRIRVSSSSLSNFTFEGVMQTSVHNQLGSIRKSRGVGAADLARRVGVSRQTIYAIEAGSYVPNTEVTLRLARELEVSVEEIFALRKEASATAVPLATRVLSVRTPAKGQPARLCRVGEHWVSVPVSASPYYLPEADGVISRVGKL